MATSEEYRTELDRIISAVDAAHEKVVEKGGTTARPYLVGNLAAAIDSIPAGGGSDFTYYFATPENAIGAMHYIGDLSIDEIFGKGCSIYRSVLTIYIDRNSISQCLKFSSSDGTLVNAVLTSDGGSFLQSSDGEHVLGMRMTPELLAMLGGGDYPLGIYLATDISPSTETDSSSILFSYLLEVAN